VSKSSVWLFSTAVTTLGCCRRARAYFGVCKESYIIFLSICLYVCLRLECDMCLPTRAGMQGCGEAVCAALIDSSTQNLDSSFS
jgi:hypothetical protein